MMMPKEDDEALNAIMGGPAAPAADGASVEVEIEPAAAESEESEEPQDPARTLAEVKRKLAEIQAMLG